MSEQDSLTRALLVSMAVVVGLGALAFWPSHKWTPAPRPTLKAPIVFDELLTRTPAAGDPGASSGR